MLVFAEMKELICGNEIDHVKEGESRILGAMRVFQKFSHGGENRKIMTENKQTAHFLNSILIY